MMLQVNMQELQVLRRALDSWREKLARYMSQETNEPRYKQEDERVIALLARVAELEDRSGHLAWEPGDVVFHDSDDKS